MLIYLNHNKAFGPDLISNKMIKHVAGAIAKPLQIIFNRSLSESIFPDIWKLGNLVPLFKKEDMSISANYRPVSLLSSFDNIQEACILVQKYLAFPHLYLSGIILIMTLESLTVMFPFAAHLEMMFKVIFKFPFIS